MWVDKDSSDHIVWMVLGGLPVMIHQPFTLGPINIQVVVSRPGGSEKMMWACRCFFIPFPTFYTWSSFNMIVKMRSAHASIGWRIDGAVIGSKL